METQRARAENVRATRRRRATTAAVAALAACGMATTLPPVRAQLGSVIRGGAVLLAVDRFGGQINTFINRTVGAGTASGPEQSTKVVPILTVGGGAYAGAVQVTGPRAAVDRVSAVAQVEGNTRIAGGQVRARGLVPVSARSVTDLGSLQRVSGVGISALVDLRL